jgi:transposase-like protein
MKKRFSQSFKIQAVEKALNRSDETTLQEVASVLGIGNSTLSKWIVKSRNNELESTNLNPITQEKRPQDFSLEERLNLIIRCSTLNESESSQVCREEGIFPHHIKQWKADFTKRQSSANKSTESKKLKAEIKLLKKEINRKDKALAETAALLVLQKKVQAIWGSDEDNSQ